MSLNHAHDPFDPAFVKGLDQHIMQDIITHYFRPQMIGFEKLPKKGPLILAANHSGNAFPYDGMILDLLLWKREGFPKAEKIRGVFEKQLSVTWWMRLFGIPNFWRRAGGIDLTFDNFHRLLDQKRRLLYFPEGVPGIGKGFNNRYKLQRFSTSFITLSARHNAPIYPVYIINAEWSIPFSYTFKPIDHLVKKLLGIPFLPLPAALLGIVFPFAWYFSLPARFTYVLGDPIDTRSLVAATGDRPIELSRENARKVANRVRDIMQKQLTDLVARYGTKPYDIGNFIKKMIQLRGKALRTLPIGWPFAMVGFARDLERGPAKNATQRFLRDWDVLGFYLPLGWPIVNLLRHLRKPPCGMRGLRSKEKRIHQGQYHWHLEKHPLPSPNQERSES